MAKYQSGAHTRYNIQYHFVWVVKYRKNILSDPEIEKKLGEIIRGIAERYDFNIISLGTDGNHIHAFLNAPPRYSPADISQINKSISAKMVFKEFPKVKQILWGGEFWGDGYYVATVGDGTTTEMIKRYIANQGKETDHRQIDQLKLF